MGAGPKEVQLEIAVEHHELLQGSGPNTLPVKEENIEDSTALGPRPKSYKWWIRVSIYSVFVVAGHAVATLLERLYFEKGGKSKWLATFIQLVGFPLLIPLYLFSMIKSRNEPDQDPKIPPPTYGVLAFVYVSIGVLVAVNSFLYTLGILYLPVSTYSLICATQLAFNALFSFFLNSQKFTPYIINSLVLLTISSTLLVFNPESSSNHNTTANPTSKSSYMVGFISTVSAAAVYGLCLSLTQLAFRKVIKQETFKAVLEMLIYQYFVATCVIFIGIFASGDWKHLNQEMEDFKLGKLSYVMTLTWSAITWGLFSVGAVGLIFEVSALFSNSICTVGLPVIPVLATVFFHDSMDGIKVISMVLAIWGFVSYIYQHYLDDIELRKKMGSIVSGSDNSGYDAK